MIRRGDLPALLTPALTGCKGSPGKTVHIAVSTGLVEPYLAYLADVLGYFREEELDVVIHEFAGSRMMESLLGGTSDAVYNSFSMVLILAGDARRVRSIFVGLETLSALLVVSGHKAGKIQRVEDLRGATIGVTTFGSPQHQALEILLGRHGLRANDVSVVAYGTGPAAIASLQHRKVDAGMINGSAFQILKRRAPEVRVLVDPRTRRATTELTGVERWPNFCLSAKVDWLEQNPAVARKLTKAMVRALRWSHSYTAEELREKLPAHLRTDNVASDIETLRYLLEGTSNDGRMPAESPAGVRRYVALTNENVRNAHIDLTATYTNKFVDEANR
ncbi:MAG: ABC transporter substrate-binding protein [Bryobacterales bacterium]|nr:ABC transporter substrate-binding protein [Bryobacterales bacterium]